MFRFELKVESFDRTRNAHVGLAVAAAERAIEFTTKHTRQAESLSLQSNAELILTSGGATSQVALCDLRPNTPDKLKVGSCLLATASDARTIAMQSRYIRPLRNISASSRIMPVPE
jgi:hypothetical protein